MFVIAEVTKRPKALSEEARRRRRSRSRESKPCKAVGRHVPPRGAGQAPKSYIVVFLGQMSVLCHW